MQILPTKELLPVVKHYLFLKSRGNDLKKLRLFSDGTMGMVFSFKNNLLNDSGGVGQLEFLPSSFLYGQISAFKNICLVNETEFIIVVFQPAGINHLIGLPACQLTDHIVGADFIFDKQGKLLYDKLAEQFTIQNKVQLLNDFFLSQMAKREPHETSLVEATVHHIFKNKGLSTSKQLVKFTGYSERQLERKFSVSVGMNPKKFSNIVRLHVFLKELNFNQHNINLTHMAYEGGYTDQSHLIKEFKKITGMTPGLYRNSAEKLTTNFVKYND